MSDMVTVEVSTLEGPALDWTVAKCEGNGYAMSGLVQGLAGCTYSPATDWAQGGPIIERLIEEGLLLERVDPDCELPKFKASLDRWESLVRGETALVTALRCHVAHKLGSTVDIPKALLPGARRGIKP